MVTALRFAIEIRYTTGKGQVGAVVDIARFEVLDSLRPQEVIEPKLLQLVFEAGLLALLLDGESTRRLPVGRDLAGNRARDRERRILVGRC